jgi:uncharacterized damage-inducible protein DinB
VKRDAIEELFDYTGWAWERIAKVIDEQLVDAYAKPMEGSGWPSIAACLSHSVSAYDGWLNMEWGQIEASDISYPATWPDPVNDWDDMKAYYGRIRESFRRAINIPDDALYEKRAYDLGSGSEQLSTADILANMVLHERGHHGDLNTLFHLHGVKSYIIDYRFFRSLPGQFVLDESDN